MPNANLLDLPPKEASRYSVPNLDRALSLLEVLSATPSGLTLSELAATLQIPTNSVFRISRTLEERGYLERQAAESVCPLRLSLMFWASSRALQGKIMPVNLLCMRFEFPCLDI
jgi:hypothetical protein